MNRTLKSIWEEFIYGAHFIALNNAIIVLITLIVINNYTAYLRLMTISYLTMLVLYKINHLQELEKDIISNPERTGYIKKKLKFFRFVILIAFISLLILIANTNLSTMLFFLFLVLMGFLYPKRLTRKIIAFKDLYISFFWSIIVFLPIFYNSLKIGPGLILFFTFILLRSLINMIYSDIKDMGSDKLSGLKTLPAVFGKNKTLSFLSILNFISLLPLIFAVYLKILPLYAVALSFIYVYTQLYIYFSRKLDINTIRKMSYIIIDGEAIFWLIAIVIGKIIIK